MSSSARRPRFSHLLWPLLCASAIGCSSVTTIDRSPAAETAPPPAAPAAMPAPSDRAADLVIAAMSFIDQPYQRGGHSAETGFDCSGFTRHLFGQTLGVELPRRVDDQARASVLRSVPREG